MAVSSSGQAQRSAPSVIKIFGSSATQLVIPAKAGIQKQWKKTGFRDKPGMTDCFSMKFY
jgi:hypothetical protein